MKQPVMLTIAFPALDPLLHASLRGRHRPGDGAGNAQKPHRGAYLCRLALRNSRCWPNADRGTSSPSS